MPINYQTRQKNDSKFLVVYEENLDENSIREIEKLTKKYSTTRVVIHAQQISLSPLTLESLRKMKAVCIISSVDAYKNKCSLEKSYF